MELDKLFHKGMTILAVTIVGIPLVIFVTILATPIIIIGLIGTGVEMVYNSIVRSK